MEGVGKENLRRWRAAAGSETRPHTIKPAPDERDPRQCKKDSPEPPRLSLKTLPVRRVT